MEQLNTVSVKLADKSSVNVKVGDKLELVCGEIVVVTRLNAPSDGLWALEAEVGGNRYWWNADGYMDGDEILRIINIIYGRPLLCKLTNEPSAEPIKIFQYSEILPCHEIVGRVDD